MNIFLWFLIKHYFIDYLIKLLIYIILYFVSSISKSTLLFMVTPQKLISLHFDLIQILTIIMIKLKDKLNTVINVILSILYIILNYI
jgi:hypothetical protein